MIYPFVYYVCGVLVALICGIAMGVLQERDKVSVELNEMESERFEVVVRVLWWVLFMLTAGLVLTILFYPK